MFKSRLSKISIVIVVLIMAVIFHFYPQLSIATGYAAKKVCTCTLATGREISEVEKNDLYFNILSFVHNKIDKKNNQVTSTIFGASPQIAIFRPGIGCILLDGKDDYNILFPESVSSDKSDNKAFKAVNVTTSGTDKSALTVAIDHAFDPDGQLNYKRTTAVVVIHRDTLIAEHYAGPFAPEIPQLGWSMTKSLMNAFIGLLVQEKKVDILQDHLFEAWTKDNRKDIKLKNLLQMNSGLQWNEDYASVSDATKMLYKSGDVSAIAISKPLKSAIGSKWNYSSGTTNLLSKFIRNQIGNDEIYLRYLKTYLFDVLGMSSAFVETDESGTFIGSSYGYATPKDWAKFGLLYLHDGIWNGVRVLPEGWVKFSSTVANGSDGIYGAQFWLNKGGNQYPDAPQDMIMANGFQGQHVFILPSHDAVIVRMGTGGDHFDANQFLKEILAALPAKKHG
jgi:CubicO group peptidase (beta-lactamase class C family)